MYQRESFWVRWMLKLITISRWWSAVQNKMWSTRILWKSTQFTITIASQVCNKKRKSDHTRSWSFILSYDRTFSGIKFKSRFRREMFKPKTNKLLNTEEGKSLTCRICKIPYLDFRLYFLACAPFISYWNVLDVISLYHGPGSLCHRSF